MSTTTPTGITFKALPLLILCTAFFAQITSLSAVTPVIRTERSIGPVMEHTGWDVKGYLGLANNKRDAELLYIKSRANVIRIPIFATDHREDGSMDMKRYNQMLKTLDNVVKAKPDVIIFASIKLQGEKTFPKWIETSKQGQVFGHTAYQPRADKYAKLIAEYIKMLHDHGHKIDILGPCNEINGIYPPKLHIEVMELLPKAMEAVNLPRPAQEFRIIMPDTYGVNSAKKYLEALEDENAEDTYDLVGSHFYAFNTSGEIEDWEDMRRMSKKPLWHTEVHFKIGSDGKRDMWQGFRDSMALAFGCNKAGVDGIVWWRGSARDNIGAELMREITRSITGSHPVHTTPGYKAKNDRKGSGLYQAFVRENTLSIWMCYPGNAKEEFEIEIQDRRVRTMKGVAWQFEKGENRLKKKSALKLKKDFGGKIVIEDMPAYCFCLLEFELSAF